MLSARQASHGSTRRMLLTAEEAARQQQQQQQHDASNMNEEEDEEEPEDVILIVAPRRLEECVLHSTPPSHMLVEEALTEHDRSLYQALASYDSALATTAEPIDRVPSTITCFIMEMCKYFEQDANTQRVHACMEATCPLG